MSLKYGILGFEFIYIYKVSLTKTECKTMAIKEYFVNICNSEKNHHKKLTTGIHILKL